MNVLGIVILDGVYFKNFNIGDFSYNNESIVRDFFIIFILWSILDRYW